MSIRHQQFSLTYTAPLHAPSLFGHFVATAVPGVERWGEGGLWRTLRQPEGGAVVHVRPGPQIAVDLWCTPGFDSSGVPQLLRQWLDLDAKPGEIEQHLGADPELAGLIGATPGVRLPGAVDPAEMALRVVFGQHISTKAASSLASKFVQVASQPVPQELRAVLPQGPAWFFPSPATIADLDPSDWPGMPATRAATVRTLAGGLAAGDIVLEPEAPIDQTRRSLLALKGIGPWTAEMIALRALGHPDAFPQADLGVLAGARAAGLPHTPRELLARSQAWRPRRSYATQLLWAASGHEAAQMPQDGSLSLSGD